MIELSKTGAYYVGDGRFIEDGPEAKAALAAEGITATKEEAKNRTMAWKILSGHNKGNDPEHLNIRFDKLTSHDITYVGIIQTARASGLERFPMPYVLTNCHNSLCAVGGTINEDDHMFGLTAAQKYGGGKMDISVTKKDHMFAVHFRDYGQGIPDSDLPFVLDKFYRGSNTQDKSGSGLGLYIVKYIAQQSGGDVVLENKQPGLEVTVTIPENKPN